MTQDTGECGYPLTVNDTTAHCVLTAGHGGSHQYGWSALVQHEPCRFCGTNHDPNTTLCSLKSESIFQNSRPNQLRPVSLHPCEACGTMHRTCDPYPWQEDTAAILRALGLSDHARSVSCHEIIHTEIIPAINNLHSLLTAAAHKEARR